MLTITHTEKMAKDRIHSNSIKHRSSFLVALLFAAGDRDVMGANL